MEDVINILSRALVLSALPILWLCTVWIYVLVMHAKAILEDDRPLSVFWYLHIAPIAFVGLVLDMLFNAIFGSLMFWEFPRELLFTSRVKRHWRTAFGWRFSLAQFWRKQLNQIDPDHVR